MVATSTNPTSPSGRGRKSPTAVSSAIFGCETAPVRTFAPAAAYWSQPHPSLRERSKFAASCIVGDFRVWVWVWVWVFVPWVENPRLEGQESAPRTGWPAWSPPAPTPPLPPGEVENRRQQYRRRFSGVKRRRCEHSHRRLRTGANPTPPSVRGRNSPRAVSSAIFGCGCGCGCGCSFRGLKTHGWKGKSPLRGLAGRHGRHQHQPHLSLRERSKIADSSIVGDFRV